MKRNERKIKKTWSVREFLRFVLPSVASMFVFSTYSIIDGIFVTHGVGELALAAVNLCMPFINAMFAVAVLLSVGTSTVCAIHIGRGEQEAANKTFTQNAFVVGACALLLTLVVHLFPNQVVGILGATDGTRAYMITYLQTVSSFAVFFMVSYCFEVMVKTGGHPSVSIVGVAACCLTNIALDYVFVMRLHMGVQGAALATGIAQGMSFLIFLTHFLRGRSRMKFRVSRPFLNVYRRILPLGLSEFSSEFALGYTTFLFNRVIRMYIGETGIVSYSLIGYVNTLVLMLVVGTTQGMQPLVSLNLGRGDRAACRGYFRYALTGGIAAAVLCFAVCQLFPEWIVSLLFERSSPTFAYTVGALRAFSFTFLVLGFNVLSAGYFTAMALPVPAMTIALSRGFITVTVALMGLAALLGGAGVWYAPALSEALCLIVTGVFLFLYRKRAALVQTA